MRILSKFKDYYDGVGRQYGKDELPLYVRETKEIKRNSSPELKELKRTVLESIPSKFFFELPHFYKLDLSQKVRGFNILTLLFCGKVYFGFAEGDKYIWENFTSYINHIKSKLSLNEQEQFESLFRKKYFHEGTLTFNLWKKEIKFSDRKIDDDMFRKIKSPIVLINKFYSPINGGRIFSDVIINPNLSHIEFFRHKDANQAYQELDMFIGNNMAEQIDLDSFKTDEIARDMAGFNEMSFKTYAPGDKKLRRKQNKILKQKGEQNE